MPVLGMAFAKHTRVLDVPENAIFVPQTTTQTFRNLTSGRGSTALGSMFMNIQGAKKCGSCGGFK
jgi:hypothetical protein